MYSVNAGLDQVNKSHYSTSDLTFAVFFYARGIDSSLVFMATSSTAPGIRPSVGDISRNTAFLMRTQCRICQVLQFISLLKSIHKE